MFFLNFRDVYTKLCLIPHFNYNVRLQFRVTNSFSITSKSFSYFNVWCGQFKRTISIGRVGKRVVKTKQTPGDRECFRKKSGTGTKDPWRKRCIYRRTCIIKTHSRTYTRVHKQAEEKERASEGTNEGYTLYKETTSELPTMCGSGQTTTLHRIIFNISYTVFHNAPTAIIEVLNFGSKIVSKHRTDSFVSAIS